MRRFLLLTCPFVTCLLAAAAFALAASPAAAAPSCAPVVEAVNQARGAGDLDRLARLYASATDPASACSGQAVLCISRSVALGYVQQFYKRLNAGAPADQGAEILRRGHEFGAPWQLLAAQGDVDFARARPGDEA